MSELSTPQAEKITQHPLETVLKDLEYLVNSLAMELEVAPSDRKAHQDLLRRTIRVAEAALQIPDQTWPVTVYPDDPTEAITIVEDDEEFAPEIEALRQQGWKIMTVTQFNQNVEKLAAQKSDSNPN
ncbi:hypothetical protein [Microseira wollei]|uniref:Uncharacterized protein n=1 Tax=Microseira wollei NIES-4236 TaxID=2530354 RepID=A0AAV3XD26_9CYAN|nr:hypothetical protein [Microseira wollei]GET40249.1 hypothetical protein MiSe_50580 [Microseira wollei NIES-4236]